MSEGTVKWSTMKPDRLEFFRTILQQKIAELTSSQEKIMTQMSTGNDRSADIIDRASTDLDNTVNIRIRDRERQLIAKVQEALRRIDEGNYGICDDCGDVISEKRLIARPVTTFCIKCKTKQERFEMKWEFPTLRFIYN